MRSTCLLAISSALFFACSAPILDESQGSSTSNIESEENAPRVEAILMRQAERRFSTRIANDGSVLSEKLDEGTFLIGGHTLTLRHAPMDEYAFSECQLGGTSWRGRYTPDELSVVDESGKATMLVEGRAQAEGMYDFVQGAEITGNVGPYLFVRESVFENDCGAAHPNYNRTAFIWDARSHQKVTFAAPASAFERAELALAGKGFDAPPYLAELVPRFDHGGHLSIGWRFEKLSSHAEADGNGTEDTVSVIIDSKTLSEPLPPELAALEVPPASIAAYLDTQSNASSLNPIVGWSRAD